MLKGLNTPPTALTQDLRSRTVHTRVSSALHEREEEVKVVEKVGEKVAAVALKPRKRKAAERDEYVPGVKDLDVSDEEDGKSKTKLTKAEKAARKAEAKASAELTRRQEKAKKESFRLATAAIPKLRAQLKSLDQGLKKHSSDQQPLLAASLKQHRSRLEAFVEEACQKVVDLNKATLSWNQEDLSKELSAAHTLSQSAAAAPKPKRRCRGKQGDTKKPLDGTEEAEDEATTKH